MIDIDGKTAVLGLIGNPVEHTLSPLIHNTIAEVDGNNTAYLPFHVYDENVEMAIRGAGALGIKGLNVTVPHKKSVMPFLDDIDELAEKIGAVNTVVFRDGGCKGYNTDALGFIRELKEAGMCVEDRSVVVVGAGGAANAVVHALLSLNVREILLFNRSVEKAEKIFGDFKDVKIYPLEGWKGVLTGKYPCIQCTSVGLAPKVEVSPIEDEEFFEHIESVIDIIYRPAETKFMRLAGEHGAKVFNGLSMLLYQAVESYQLFTGEKVSDDAVKKAGKRLAEAVWKN
ncbi:MAG: shikimate dehydrogenase [Lachnospiraceae bacterium]|nr:shikimate dehydrogenase [Lachnospiraceae bacterium]